MKQLGSLGSGNHFAEVQYVEHIYDQAVAEAMGIGQVGQIVVTIHCGSRGFGHQIAEDYIKLAEVKQAGYGFHMVDRQLASLPLQSDEGKAYMATMACEPILPGRTASYSCTACARRLAASSDARSELRICR
jgi:tRNA-splicing ligase RtcB